MSLRPNMFQLLIRTWIKPTFRTSNSVLKRFSTATSPTLRVYQQQCLNVCLEQLQEGVKRQAISLPVGGGKTV